MRAVPTTFTRGHSALAWLPDLPLSAVIIPLIGALVLVQAAHGFTDPDYWWHFKTGELIMSRHLIPHTDPFTYTQAGQPWIAHEWLAEALIYLLVHAGGYGLALLAFSLSPLAALLFIYGQLRLARIPDRLALPLTALSALMVAPYTTVRPQVLSWALFAALFFLLAAYRAGYSKSLWALPPLFALWVNLHLSFAIGLTLLGLFLATRISERFFLRHSVQVRYPILVFAVSILAACLNPYGPRIFLTPLRYLPLQSAINAPLQLAEWLPPDFHNYLFAPLLAALLLLMAFGLGGRQPDFWRLSLGLGTAALALLAVRYIPIFAVAFAPIAGEAIRERWPSVARGDPSSSSPERKLLRWLLLGAVSAVLLVGIEGGRTSQFQRQPSVDTSLMPELAVDYIAHQAPNARIFNQYEWGGYLIYRLWPENRPFIDGRDEMFSSTLLHDYVTTYLALPGWQQTLDRYGVTLVIVRRNSPLAGALEVAPHWHLASSDHLADVYLRD